MEYSYITLVSITQTKLAELAGVSQYAVHRALHGHDGVSEETRQRIHDLATKHGYRLNTAARNMRTGRTGQIGVLMLDSPDRRYVHPALFELTWGVNAGLEAGGYVTTLVRLTDLDRPDADEARIFREHLLDGVIVMNMLPDHVMQKIQRLVPNCVWLDTNMWAAHNCLQRDEEHAGQLAARALINAGHRKIVHLVRPESQAYASMAGMTHYSTAARVRGLHAEAAAAHVEVIPLTVRDLNGDDMNALESHLVSDCGLFVTRLSEARRVAAMGSGRFHARWGVDYSISCADDAADVEWWWPELARVRFDRIEMGRIAAEMMIAKMSANNEATRSRCLRGSFAFGATLITRTS